MEASPTFCSSADNQRRLLCGLFWLAAPPGLASRPLSAISMPEKRDVKFVKLLQACTAACSLLDQLLKKREREEGWDSKGFNCENENSRLVGLGRHCTAYFGQLHNQQPAVQPISAGRLRIKTARAESRPAAAERFRPMFILTLVLKCG